MRLRSRGKGAIGGIGASRAADGMQGKVCPHPPLRRHLPPMGKAGKLTAASGWMSLKGETDGRTGTVRAAICRAGATRTPKVQRLLTERTLYYP